MMHARACGLIRAAAAQPDARRGSFHPLDAGGDMPARCPHLICAITLEFGFVCPVPALVRRDGLCIPQRMASISITISPKAHARLRKLKTSRESLTDVILREKCEPCDTGREILDSLKRDYPPRRKLRHAA